MHKTFGCTFLFVWLIQHISPCQPLQTDSIFLQQAILSSIKLYNDAIQGQAALYNGSQYVEPLQTSDKHPFFLSDDWTIGSIRYDGDVYNNVPLLYDISTDRIVTELYYNSNPIALINQKVSWFSLSAHTFERIQKEAVNNSIPQTGFYDVLYDGPSKVIARRQKTVHERIESNKIEKHFEPKNRYYVFKSGRFHNVGSKASVLKIFEDQKQALKQFLRQKKISYKQNHDLALRALAKHYDFLKTSQ